MTVEEIKIKLLRRLDAAYLELRAVFEGNEFTGEGNHSVFGKWYLPSKEIGEMEVVAMKLVKLNELISGI